MSAFILCKPLLALSVFVIFVIVFMLLKKKLSFVIVPMYIILFIGMGYAGWLTNAYHRIGIVLRCYPLVVAKACFASSFTG